MACPDNYSIAKHLVKSPSPTLAIRVSHKGDGILSCCVCHDFLSFGQETREESFGDTFTGRQYWTDTSELSYASSIKTSPSISICAQRITQYIRSISAGLTVRGDYSQLRRRCGVK